MKKKDVVLCHFNCLIHFHTNFSFEASEFESWQDRSLIINAEDDIFVGKDTSSALRFVFPTAKFYSFESGGHILSLTKHDE